MIRHKILKNDMTRYSIGWNGMELCHLGCGRGMGQGRGRGRWKCEMLDVGYFGRERRIDGNGNRESKRVCGTKRKRKRKR